MRNRRLDPQGYIYVIEFSFGVVKVGKTNSPRLRIRAHERDVGRFGGSIARAWLSFAHHGYSSSESELIRATSELGTQLVESAEYFRDCSFEAVVNLAAHIQESTKKDYRPWGIPGLRAYTVPDADCEDAFTRIMTGWRDRELGLSSWSAHCKVELRDVESRAWSLHQRQRLVRMLRRERLSVRAIAVALGCSVGPNASDLKDLGDIHQRPADTMSLDGRRRPAATAFTSRPPVDPSGTGES
ncbi:MAG: putative DNA-binding protein [Streptosporangiaceae bacterium]|nr:putative DNA-binding protein [Streptosporangiaceae bacterium]